MAMAATSLAIDWSPDQSRAISQIVQWFREASADGIRFGGLAGTGKTTIAAHISQALGLSISAVAYCAYTGKAAQVLTRKLTQFGVTAEATTIHSLIYRPQDTHCSACPSQRGRSCHQARDLSCGCGLVFNAVDELDPMLSLIIVDEASMVDGEIYSDLASYDIPIIWMGDHGQLPPVNGSFSLMERLDIKLETVHRQVADSPILQLAMQARNGLPIAYANYAPGVRKTKVLELDIDTEEDHLILCYTNANRVWLNTEVRRLLGYPANRPVPDDRVICLRNNRKAGIFNGMLGTVVSVQDRPNAYFLEVSPDNTKTNYRGIVSAEQFGQPKTLISNLDLWDYGYCLTVHKAQGSEAERVTMLDDFPYWAEDRSRWLYTGITRARKELTIIDFHRKRPRRLEEDDPILTDD